MSLIPAFKIGIWNIWLFMSVFALQILAMWFAGKKIRERSHVPAEVKRTKLEKNIVAINQSIWLLAMGYSIFLPLQLGTVWFIFGFSLFIIGFILMIISTANFIITDADKLITKGAYKFSRNPIYLASLFICMGSGIAAASWLFIFFSLVIAFCFHREILVEERYCLDIYSNIYQEYLNNVPRWFSVRVTHEK